MSHIADLIKTTQAEKTAALDELTLCIKSMEAADPADEALNKTLNDQAEASNAKIEVLTKKLDTYQKSEMAMFQTAAPAIIQQQGDHKDPLALVVRNALCTYEAHVKRVPLAQVMQERYGNYRDFEATKAVSDFMITRAAQNPAATNVAGWAQELTQMAYGAFMDLLTPTSVVAALPMERYSFDGFNSIYIPMRLDRTKTLSGAFRAEGAPIPVKGTTLSSLTLTPKTMGVISSFTQEMLRRSTPGIEQLIRKWMLEDTSITLDSVFLGTGAGSATQPAGIANALGANTAASAGNTSADITADVRGMLQRMAGANLGGRPVWIMDPQRKIGLELSLTPTGTLAFPSVGTNNTFLGYPIITSLNVVDTEVFLVDCSQVGFAGGVPNFVASDVATIHEEDTTPLALASGVQGSAVVATPARSLFQTYSAALRAVWELDWKVFRTGAIQQLTAVTW